QKGTKQVSSAGISRPRGAVEAQLGAVRFLPWPRSKSPPRLQLGAPEPGSEDRVHPRTPRGLHATHVATGSRSPNPSVPRPHTWPGTPPPRRQGPNVPLPRFPGRDSSHTQQGGDPAEDMLS
ncbi:hypothetical protein H1C71_040575, partial [Ictidomys tridecemlineatus]